MATQFNKALGLLALAVRAQRAGNQKVAARALIAASKDASVKDVLATVDHQLASVKKEKVKAAAGKAAPNKALADLAKAIAEAEDSDNTGEDLRIEVEDVVTSEAEDDDEKDDDDDGDDDDDDSKEEVAKFQRTLSNLGAKI